MEITSKISIGGRAVPRTAASMPGKPAIRQPSKLAAFTAMAPGLDWPRETMSIISFSSIQWSSSTKRRFIKLTITNPPPKVKLLIKNILENSCHRVFSLPVFCSMLQPPFLLMVHRIRINVKCAKSNSF